MRFLYWNLCKKDLSFILSEICIEYNIDILIVSEHHKMDVDFLLSRLRKKNFFYRGEYVDRKKKSIIFCKEEVECNIILDGNRYCAHKIKFNDMNELLLVSVHLLSQNNNDFIRQTHSTSRIKSEIESIERTEKLDKTIIVGDFNMNPFDRGMVDFFGFNSTMSLKEAKKIFREVEGEKLSYFFNPMWHYMGNVEKEVLGTYYYRNNDINVDWNTFDQIIIRPRVLETCNIDNIEFKTKVNDKLLITNYGIPDKKNYSDHLPLYFEIGEV